MSIESRNSSDVTLVREVNHQPVCKFYQTGFCKFGQKSNKMHNDASCSKINCTSVLCISRHPKLCKYFFLSGTCKFGKDCAFDQKKSKTILQIGESEKMEMNI